MRRKYDISDSKETVALRKRAMKGGGYSLYLDYTINGVRKRDFLKLYLVPEHTKIDSLQNQETLKTANAMKSKRIVEIQNGECGFRVKKGENVTLLDYMEENPSKRMDSRLKPRMKESTREFLTLDEVRILMDTPCKDDRLKAAFLFACFTGLRISDIRSLTWDKIIDEGGGYLHRVATPRPPQPQDNPDLRQNY